MSDYKNYHLVEVKYLGATDTKGSRVKLTSHRFKNSVTLPYDYKFNQAYEIAINWLEVNEVDIVGLGEWKNGQAIVITDTFEPLMEVN